ncbi:MAG: penicillin-binding protein activator [Pseudomonadota bacterium]
MNSFFMDRNWLRGCLIDIRKVSRTALACFGMVTLLAACATGGQETAQLPLDPAVQGPPETSVDQIDGFELDPIRIAVLVPQSGPQASVGEALLNAAQMAFFDAFDPRIELLSFDTKGTAKGAETAAIEAVAANVVAIIGPLFSTNAKVIAPIALRADIPVFTFSNDATVAGGRTYVFGVLPGQEVEAIVDHAVDDLGLRRFAALVPHGSYGEVTLDRFAAKVNAGGGSIVAVEVFDRTSAGVFDPIRRISQFERRKRELRQERDVLEELNDDMSLEFLSELENRETMGQPPFEALFIAEGGALMHTIAPLLAINEIDEEQIQILGTGYWSDRSLVREPSLHGARFAALESPDFSAFSKRFEENYARLPPRIASLGYDAAALVIHLAREPILDFRFSSEQIEAVEGFSGVDGIFRFGSDKIVRRALTIREITAEGIRNIVTAPTSFERDTSLFGS